MDLPSSMRVSVLEFRSGGLTMLIKKMTFSKSDSCITRKYIALFLDGFMLLALAASLDVHAAGKVNAYGILTSIEDDGTVVIDGIGYLVSPSVTIQDYRGTSISFYKIKLPHNVHFEYEYSKEGLMIIFIEETAG